MRKIIFTIPLLIRKTLNSLQFNACHAELFEAYPPATRAITIRQAHSDTKRFFVKAIYFMLLVIIFLLIAGNQQVFGEKKAPVKRELEREKNELNRIKSKLSAEAEKIKKEAKREKSILGQLGTINKNLNKSQKELRKHQKNLKSTNKKLSGIEARLKKNQKKIQSRQKLLKKRLRVLYKEEEPSYLKVVFSATDANDFLQRLKYMKIIANYDSELISQYKADVESLKASKKELQETAKKVALYKTNAEKKKNEVLQKKKKKQVFLNNIRGRKGAHEKIQKELLEASKELGALIHALEKNYVEESRLTFHERKGFLPWPVRGKVITPFGKVKNKRFNTVSFNNGIEIKAPVGKNVRAIFEGEVLYAGELKGYGLMVILGHGKGYYSLYAHLSESLVKKGDRVTKNKAFAYTGDSDAISGPSLYFEIRNKRVPENPLKWLSIAKK